MKYLGRSFSLAMPGAGIAHWPFKAKEPPTTLAPSWRCPSCGALLANGREPHPRPDDAGRPRRVICFGVQ